MSSTISMLGKPPKGSYFLDVPWGYYIGTKEKDGEDFVDINDGINELHDAVSLWCLVDDERATELADFIKNVLYCELNNREIMFPGEEKDGYLIDVETVKELYDLIGDIDEIVAKEFTENQTQDRFLKYYVLPKKEDFVGDFRVGEWIDDKPDSRRINLGKEIGNVMEIKNFLKIAIENNRELIIG